MNFPCYTFSENYNERQKERYLELLHQLGTSIRFNEDIWVCDKRLRSAAEQIGHVSIRFTKVPENYKELCKYFAIMRLLNGNVIRTVQGNVTSLTVFLKFLSEVHSNISISTCDISIASSFKTYLDASVLGIQTKRNIWSSAGNLLKTMDGFDGMKCKNPFRFNPYPYKRKLDSKYIPDSVAKKLDAVFMNGNIDVYFRCIYWILRLIPSRISEVLGMKINCIKPFNGKFVLFIPTWKQNGGHVEPILRSIHLHEEGIAGHLIGLIQEQQTAATALQSELPENKRNTLFSYRRALHYKNKTTSTAWKAHVMTLSNVSYHFRRICEQYGIRGEDGEVYNLTSHQFRHNGITDRLEAGFTLEQIADMTGHHGNAMIWNSYAHLDLKPKTIQQKQKYVLAEPESTENPYILFGGRILNMEEMMEKRLLKNLRAHRVPGGICSDITGCKSDMWDCLECEHFIPDKEQLSYFKEQADSWRVKAERFLEFPVIHANALRNAGLFECITAKLTGGEDVE